MARSLEPYKDRALPERFLRWIETLRFRIQTVPCFAETIGSPEGVISAQKGDLAYDIVACEYYVKNTNVGNTGWALLAGAGGGGVQVAGVPVDNQLAIWTDANTIEGDSNLSFDGNDLVIGSTGSVGALYLHDRLSVPANIAGFGALWVRDDVPNNLMFSDDSIDYEIPRSIGNPLSSQIAFWGIDHEIQGDGDLRFVSGNLSTEKIRLTRTTDASLSSTNHAFQVGASGGNNIIMDTNELMARSGGSAGDLFINSDGGETGFGTAGGGTMRLNGTFYFHERAAALGDTAARGQLWVRDDTPNILMFTDDAGTDFIVDVTPA